MITEKIKSFVKAFCIVIYSHNRHGKQVIINCESKWHKKIDNV